MKKQTATESATRIRREFLKADASGNWARAERLVKEYEQLVRLSLNGKDPYL